VLPLIGTCPPLAAPDNGVVDCSLGEDGLATKGDMCTIKCENGFELKHGSQTRKCWVWWAGTMWTGRQPYCTKGLNNTHCAIHTSVQSSQNVYIYSIAAL